MFGEWSGRSRIRIGGGVFGLALLASVVSCDRSPTAPPQEGTVSALSTRSGILLTNRTDSAAAFAAMNSGLLAMIAPCIDPGPACLRLRAGGSLLVPYSEVMGYRTDLREVTVYWWHVVPATAGGYQIDEVRTIKVPISGSH